MLRDKAGILNAVLVAILSAGCAKEKAIDREAALKMVLEMPEVKALEQGAIENGGIGIAAYAEESPNRYWEVSVYQNYHDHHPRYETFLVRTDGAEILRLKFLD